jgi:hypothetical protein
MAHDKGRAAGIRIGCGAGFAGDRIDPAVDLARRGALDFLFFECLAERTLALSQLARQSDPTKGYNTQLERRFLSVLPGCRDNGTRIVTNMGAANPRGAGEMLAFLMRREGFSGTRIAVIEGDDVKASLALGQLNFDDRATGGDDGKSAISANAYLGADPIVEALDMGADIVITGRVADPSLVVAPLIHSFGWRADDWNLLGSGTMVGHLLECSCQVTGGYFADPGFKSVPNLAYVGYPLAEVTADGRAVITKLDGSGGCVTPLTVKEQLMYEVHDPAAYITPDVIADFTDARVEIETEDRIRVSGARGRERPDQLKVTVGFDGGFLAESEISYAGPGAGTRARLAADIVFERMHNLHGFDGDLRIDMIGVSSLHATANLPRSESADVRMRAAMRSGDRSVCEMLLSEFEAVWIAGPAGGGGVRGTISPSVTTRSAFIDRDLVKTHIEVFEV